MASDSVTLRRVTPQELFSEPAAWARLLKQSRCDPLFLCYDWQQLWWQTYAHALDAQPLMFRAVDAQRNTVGFIPLYSRRIRRAGVFPLRTVELVGSSWRDGSTMLSEYLAPLLSEPAAAPATLELLDYLQQLGDWGELVVSSTPTEGAFGRAVIQSSPGRRWLVREHDRSRAHQADLQEGFDGYLRQLSSGSRRHVFNHRRRLARKATVKFEVIEGEAIVPHFATLNRLHTLRWGSSAFAGARLCFHEQLATRSNATRQSILSILRCGGQPVSALYDIRCEDRQYNIQMGFDALFDTSVSLGLLHLGYAMEHAYGNGVVTYDLLAGGGKRTDYKAVLGGKHIDLHTLQAIRSPILRTLFGAADRARGRKPQSSR